LYAYYIFNSKQGSDTVFEQITRDGQPYYPWTEILPSYTQGFDCLRDSGDWSTMPSASARYGVK
jgi:hypothetical protein